MNTDQLLRYIEKHAAVDVHIPPTGPCIPRGRAAGPWGGRPW